MFSHLINKILIKRNIFKEEFIALEASLEKFIFKNNQFSILAPFVFNRGKRIRSILYFLNWDHSFNLMKSEKYKTIALIELMHFASIIHDDVVDNNKNRRNGNSFMKEYGIKKSILFGDFALIKTVNEFITLHSENEFVKKLFLRECSATAYGAVLEQQLNQNSSFQDYIKVASLKTSPFFKLVCFLGKFLSTNDFETAKKAASWGVCFGILFQAQNDFDGYAPENFNESEDFIEKNITFPIIILRDEFGYDISKFYISNQENYMEIKNAVNSDEFKTVSKQYFNKFLNYLEFMSHTF